MDKKNNIPTHDPYTGALNPYYEELTGKPNPYRVVQYKTSDMNLYSDIEELIMRWSDDGTKTAGHLTRQIMDLIKGQNRSEQQNQSIH